MSVKAFELVSAIERIKLMSEKAKTQVNTLNKTPYNSTVYKLKLSVCLVFTKVRATVRVCSTLTVFITG